MKYDLITTTLGYNIDPSVCLLKNDMLAVTNNDSLLIFDTTEYYSDRDDKQAILQSSGNSATNCLIGQDGNPQSMQWSSALSSLTWDEPFIIGRIGNGVEIRCLETCNINQQTLLQTFTELNRVKSLVKAKSGVIFAAGATEIWCLRRVEIPLQRQKLLENKFFQLAIDLTVSKEKLITNSTYFKNNIFLLHITRP